MPIWVSHHLKTPHDNCLCQWKVVSYNRDRYPITCSVLMKAKQNYIDYVVVKLIFITRVLEAIGDP